MGLSILDIFMEIEERFSLDLPDDECEQVRTVGDLYRLVLKKLDLPYQPAAEIESLPRVHLHRFDPWTTPAVWYTLKDIILDQLQVDEDEVRESASFQKDLGAD